MKRHIFWSCLEAASGGLLSILSAFVIARLIGPAELGVGAAAASVHVLLWVAVNAMFADALVQRATMDDTVASSAFWASCATGLLAMPVQAGAGWLLAGLLHDHRLIPMALLLALPLPLVGAGGAMQGILTRARGYRALAARTVLGQGSGAAVGIVLASHGAGAWAPVVQLAVSSAVGGAVLVITAGWRPRMVFSVAAARALLRVGLPLTASTLVQLGRYRLFAILIGGTAGAAALGRVHVAFRLVDTVRELTFTALWRLMLPILSEQQHDRAALLATVDRLLVLSSRWLLPLCGVLTIALVPVVSAALGPDWAAAGRAARPLVGSMALAAVMFPSGAALVAAGGARQALAANVAGLVATMVLVLTIRPADAWNAVLVWCAGQLFVSPYALWMNGRVLGVGPLRPLRGGLVWLVPSMLAVAAVLAG